MTDEKSSPALPSIRQVVHVPVEPARAFELFTTRMRDWWNPAVSTRPTKPPIADIVVEPRVGGRWYERGTDGAEHEWGVALAFDAASRLVFDWRPDGISTELEITFTGPAPRRTDVTLLHRGFDRFGNQAEQMYAVHEQCWTDLLDRFAAFVSQHARGGSSNEPRPAGAAPRALTDGETILAAMDLPATPDRIFKALTTAECGQWWGAPDTYQATAWKSDTRVGGAWCVDIRLADGSIFPASGSYVEIDEPRRIVFTRRYDWDYPEFGRRDTRVTYLLDPLPGGTRLTVRQDGFAGFRGPAAHHADGWEHFLTYLDTYLRHSGK